MILTEEQAKKKWCPFANTRLVTDSSFPSDRCMGSACMAWRWDPEVEEVEGSRFTVYKRGHCGLAGRG